MFHQLTLCSCNSVGEQVYDFTDFELSVGRNNSGKSTVLKALAIWRFCVDEFHRAKRSGSTGIQIEILLAWHGGSGSVRRGVSQR